MKQRGKYLGTFIRMLVTASICLQILDVSAQCNANFIYGLTNVGMIQRIKVSNGSVAAPINPAFTGNAPNLSNALGYNPLNGKYYFFKRNTTTAPQEFVSFDPATNLYASLASSPVGTGNIINLGCVNNTGLGYYCLDAFGALYYYDVALNTWAAICSNIKDQFGVTLSSIIAAGSLNRYYGDVAFDGNGNLWILISGAVDYGLYKISGPLPTSAVANLTATQLIPPNTASPGGTFGGIAFSASGAIYISSNSPNNKLYQLTNVNTLSFVTNLATDGIGNDLTSCNFPLNVLPVNGIKLSASLVNGNTVILNWTVVQSGNSNGYEVERSSNGIKWEEIYFSPNKADDLSASYTFSESSPSRGVLYYRIRETDRNGEISYSTAQKINPDSHTRISIWPNPVQDIMKLQTGAGGATTSQAFIYDLSGRMIRESNLKGGANIITVHDLQPGTYIVQLKLSDGTAVNQKFVKQ